MAVYARETAMALRLIAAKGQLVTWRRVTVDVTGDGGTPAEPGQTITDHSVRMVFLPNEKDSFGALLAHMTDTEVPKSGVKALMGRVSFDPDLNDLIIRGDAVFSINPHNGLEVIDPNGEGAILYKLRLVR